MEAEYKLTQFGALMLIIFFVTGVLIALVLLSMLAEGRLVVAFVSSWYKPVKKANSGH